MFQSNVDKIHALGIFLPFVEWTFIFLPLLFHAILGVVIIKGGLPNTTSYPLAKNIRYTLQRATGLIAFIFIFWHVMHMHGMGKVFAEWGGGQFDPHHAAESASGAIQAALWVQVCYAIGVLSCVYHLANGLWTMGITWGVWTSPAAMRRADYVCTAFGLGLAFVGLSALWGFSNYQPSPEAQALPAVHEAADASVSETSH